MGVHLWVKAGAEAAREKRRRRKKGEEAQVLKAADKNVRRVGVKA